MTDAPDPPLVLTFDIDWAPDWMVERALAPVLAAGLPVTVFATHPSALLDELATEPSVEIGLHPNFLPGSSHGATPDAVLSTLFGWYPKAQAARTHSLVQSEPLLALLARRGVRTDCSIHLPLTPGVDGHALRLEPDGPLLVRLPHVFQDNMHMLRPDPWRWPAAFLFAPGLKVLNFHPVHVALNSRGPAEYAALKGAGPIPALVPADLDPAPGEGTAWFLDRVVELAKEKRARTVSAYAEAWRRERGLA